MLRNTLCFTCALLLAMACSDDNDRRGLGDADNHANNPVDPNNPNQPVDPNNPNQPVDPNNPNQPVDPNNPNQPVDPNNPNQPVDTNHPHNTDASDSDIPWVPTDSDNVPNLDIAREMPLSFMPPGGLSVAKTPMFIVLGYDDNRYEDGMQWVLDMMLQHKNPAGSGNDATFDGHNLKASFYFTTDALDDGGEALLAQWRRAVDIGHEAGNHTHTHRERERETPFVWQEELTTCNSILAEKLGIPRNAILGVRAPFLDFLAPPLFDTLAAGLDGIIYDCSIRHDPYGDDPENWTFYRHVWPYTLEKGLDVFTAGGYAIGNPAIWEVPCYSLPTSGDRASMRQPQNMYTGFDSTAYATSGGMGMSAAAFHDSLKWALELRMAEGDNRAPLTIGLHSDTYSAQNTGYSQPLAERRAALADFVDYALRTYPEVRFVSTKQLLMWMSHPTPLP